MLNKARAWSNLADNFIVVLSSFSLHMADQSEEEGTAASWMADQSEEEGTAASWMPRLWEDERSLEMHSKLCWSGQSGSRR